MICSLGPTDEMQLGWWLKRGDASRNKDTLQVRSMGVSEGCQVTQWEPGTISAHAQSPIVRGMQKAMHVGNVRGKKVRKMTEQGAWNAPSSTQTWEGGRARSAQGDRRSPSTRPSYLYIIKFTPASSHYKNVKPRKLIGNILIYGKIILKQGKALL